MNNLNVVIPMAGRGARFVSAGFLTAKPFIDVDGLMMIERVLNTLPNIDKKIYLIILEEFREKYKEKINIIENNFPVFFVTVPEVTQGAACSILSSHRKIDNSIPLLCVDSDNLFLDKTLDKFIIDAFERKLDGSLLCFDSDEKLYSYARVDANQLVVETKEKENISKNAICGAYFFGKGSDFVDSTIMMMILGDQQKKEYYLSNVFNYMVKSNKKIGIFTILRNQFACLGTPEQLESYLNEK